jgi:predicted lactoylglutathione lyase
MAGKSRKIFVNIAVRDLEKAMQFFRTLGFDFNMKFTDKNAACMIISEEAYVMLLTEPFLKTFTKRELADTTKSNEALLAISCDSKAEVDEMVRKAIDAGGRQAMDSTDHGFMYAWSFYDIDGHHWEVMWMDPNAVQ